MSEFDALVEAAAPYARQALDFDAMAAEISATVRSEGDPAVYMTAVKDHSNPKSFPVALQFLRRTDTDRTAPIGSFEITRPDYDDNEEGFRGNHLVVAIIHMAKESLQGRIPRDFSVFTSMRDWTQHCSVPGYFAKKEENAMTDEIESKFEEPAAKRRSAPGSL